MIDSAESNIQAAKNLLNEINGENFSTKKYKDKASHLTPPVISSSVTGRVVEGVFDGQNMMGSDQKSYPVPANYASKSKLIPGDHLKLTIKENGAFIYKQIGPIERKRVIGKLTYDDGQYKVVVGANIYNVLLASVTYFKVQVGQNVTVIVPAEGDSEWSAIENSMDSPDVEAAIKEVEKNDEDTTFDISQTKVTE
jgi:hypothetical protein